MNIRVWVPIKFYSLRSIGSFFNLYFILLYSVTFAKYLTKMAIIFCRCQAVVWGGIWPLDRQCTLKKLGVFLQVEIWNPLFTSAKKPCITQEGECPAGQFKPAGHRVDCKTCPAGSYSKAGASSCTKCPAGLYSKEGAGSCSNCYKSKTENVKMNTNGVEKGTSFEAAAAACVIDDRCDGVTCMKKEKDKCFTGVGMGSSKSKKWYSFEKDC